VHSNHCRKCVLILALLLVVIQQIRFWRLLCDTFMIRDWWEESLKHILKWFLENFSKDLTNNITWKAGKVSVYTLNCFLWIILISVNVCIHITNICIMV